MQLLIDIADIHLYRERCETWSKKRMTHLINNAVIESKTGTLNREHAVKTLTEFDNQNPYPQILPANV